jgi:hypothetical protein
MSYEPDNYGPPVDSDGARTKTNIPGVLLIVVGILNVLFGLLLVFRGVQIAMSPVADIVQAREQMRQLFPNLPEDQTTPEQYKTQTTATALIWGAVTVVLALVTLFGGVLMRGLRGYGLAIVGSILALIPCVSPAGCCLLGVVAGIWALIVLANADVRSAFR